MAKNWKAELVRVMVVLVTLSISTAFHLASIKNAHDRLNADIAEGKVYVSKPPASYYQYD